LAKKCGKVVEKYNRFRPGFYRYTKILTNITNAHTPGIVDYYKNQIAGIK